MAATDSFLVWATCNANEPQDSAVSVIDNLLPEEGKARLCHKSFESKRRGARTHQRALETNGHP